MPEVSNTFLEALVLLFEGASEQSVVVLRRFASFDAFCVRLAYYISRAEDKTFFCLITDQARTRFQLQEFYNQSCTYIAVYSYKFGVGL